MFSNNTLCLKEYPSLLNTAHQLLGKDSPLVYGSTVFNALKLELLAQRALEAARDDSDDTDEQRHQHLMLADIAVHVLEVIEAPWWRCLWLYLKRIYLRSLK